MWRMRLGEQWVASGLLSSSQVEAALDYQARWGGRLGEVAVVMGLLTSEQLLVALARQHQLPFVRREGLERVPDGLLRCVPSRMLSRLHVFPLRIEWPDQGPGHLLLATSEPERQGVLDEMALATGCRVRPVLALADDLTHVLWRHGLFAGRLPAAGSAGADVSVL